MSVEDEIRARKEKIYADKRASDEKKKEADRLAEALLNASMDEKSPVLIVPAPELRPIILETMPSMRFTKPKIVRKMPDGRTYVRPTSGDGREPPDMYSFDIELCRRKDGKVTEADYMADRIDYMWIFKNGTVSFNCRGIETYSYKYGNHYRTGHRLKMATNLTWEYMHMDAAEIREKIMEALVNQSIQDDQSKHDEAGKKSSSEGCYIATAVYGSYDCPEVWVLRRYRDYSLKNSALGRIFIRIYYATSPTLIKWFGKKAWFTLSWRKFLDKKIAVLKKAGYSDKEYSD